MTLVNPRNVENKTDRSKVKVGEDNFGPLMVVTKPKCVVKSKGSRCGGKEPYAEGFNKFAILNQVD